MNTKKLLAAAIAALPAFAFADQNSTKVEDEIIVTATKNPQFLKATLPTAHVISALDIERLQPQDLLSLLGRVSGININDTGGRGSTSSLFIRGASSSQSVVLVDGVRTASATTGVTALQSIPVESIERIEIVKGPLSGLYGADAIGGVIQIFTKKGASKGLEARVKASYGTHHNEKHSLQISGGNDFIQYTASVEREDTDGIDRTDLEVNGNQDRDGFDERSGTFSANINFSESLKAQINYLNTDNRSEFDNPFGVDAGRFSDGNIENVSGKLTYDLNDRVSLSANLGYFSDHLITPAFASDIQTRRRTAGAQGDIRVSDSGVLTVGADYYDDDVTTNSNFTETDRENAGLFVQYLDTFGDFSLVTSLRHDDNEAYGENTNGSASLGYQINDGLQVVVSYGTAFTAPSFNQLYFPGFGNPDLDPEESETYEVALKGISGATDWRVSLFRSDVEDLIGGFPVGNVNEAVLEGVEVEASTELQGWSINGNVTYLEARDEDTDEYLDDRATWTVNLIAGRAFGPVYVTIDGKAEHGRHDRSGTRIRGFDVWGIAATYDVTPDLKLSLNVDNLFDQEYVQNLATSTVAYETEGRVAQVGVEFTFR